MIPQLRVEWVNDGRVAIWCLPTRSGAMQRDTVMPPNIDWAWSPLRYRTDRTGD